jgi:DNA modification methylase
MQVHIKDIKMVSLSELRPHPKNPNKHSKEQISRLAKILEYQGWRYPIKVSNRSGFITSGHGRLLAAKHLGLDSVPVSYQDYADDDAEYADIVSDNAIASWADLDYSAINSELANFDPSFDIDLLGIENFKVDVAEKEGLTDPDAIPENVDFKVKPGDVWILGAHRLMCGDSTNSMHMEKLMAGAQANMMWTDPPYNVAYNAGKSGKDTIENDDMEDSEFRQFLTDAFSLSIGFVAPGGAFYVAHADSEGFNFRASLRDSGWLVKQCLIWNKNSLVMGRQDYQWKHEPILYGWRPGAAHKWFSDRSQTTVIDFEKSKKNDIHPTMKPVGLIEYFLNNSSAEGESVLDIFAGSGSTLMAAERLGRSCFSMEIDPRFASAIVKRWEDYTGLKAELAAEGIARQDESPNLGL